MARLPRYYKVINTRITNTGIEYDLIVRWWAWPIIFVKGLINRIK